MLDAALGDPPILHTAVPPGDTTWSKIEPRVVDLVKPRERVVGWRPGRGGRDMYVPLSGGCVGGLGLLLDYRGRRAESLGIVQKGWAEHLCTSSPQAARSFRNAGWSWVTHVNSVEA